MGRPHRDRAAAVKAFYWAQGCLPLAILLMHHMAPAAAHGNLYSFIPYWVKKFEERHSVLTKKPAGPTSAIDEMQARECMALLDAGYINVSGQHRFYRSIRHAVLMCPRLQEILTLKQLKQQQLLRRMKAVCPELCRRTLRFVRHLGPATKAERAAYCSRLLLWTDAPLEAHLARYMWIDAKIVYVVPKGCLVYAPPGADLYIEDERLPRSASQIKKIHYYAVVNAVIGPVYFQLVTGTTHIRDCDPDYPAAGYEVGGWGCLTPLPPHSGTSGWPSQTSNGGFAAPLSLPAA
jgi:hypothetical protein